MYARVIRVRRIEVLPDEVEKIVLAIVGGGGIGWLIRYVVDGYKTKRVNDRDDFQVAFDRLRGQVDSLLTSNAALRDELSKVYTQLHEAELKITRLHAFIHTLAAMTSDKCPYDDERCPVRAWIRAEKVLEADGA